MARQAEQTQAPADTSAEVSHEDKEDAAVAAANAEAATEAAADPKETKGQSFVRLATKRMGNALTAIKAMEGLTNKNNYDFSEKHVAAMISALNAQVKELDDKFSGKVDAKSGFTFGEVAATETATETATATA